MARVINYNFISKRMGNAFVDNDRPVLKSGPGLKRKEGIPSEVIEQLRDGNHAAFELVYRLYQADVKRFLLSLAKDNELAEDVMQEAFIYLWEKKEQIDPSKNIANYLFHVVRNMLISRLRKNQVANRYLRDLTFDDVLYAADASMIAEETAILVNIVVSQMPKQRRKIYEMSRYEGLTNKEIADKLGVDTRNVRTQLHYATKEIKDVIGMFLLLFII